MKTALFHPNTGEKLHNLMEFDRLTDEHIENECKILQKSLRAKKTQEPSSVTYA